ncbi:MAG: acyltransferase [Sneathiella sp.]|nr:acyltransferase [Sneathiella sp.]
MSFLKGENPHLNLGFRKDINLLRAFAVSAVILFHFDFDFALGGYLGVDAFFVISGYLMTAIVLSRLSEARFSLLGFYKSRFLRIVPALVVLCLLLGVLGWFLIFPFDYAYLAKNINHALAFKSNVSFSHGAGYFETGAKTKWLLHTWSLSVEMQFYLIYPLFLLVLYKLFGLRVVQLAIAAGLMASLGSYLWNMQAGDVNEAFYLLPNRAWQLLAGAAVVAFPVFNVASGKGDGSSSILRVVGIVLIFTSAIFGIGDDALAVLWAVLTTLGVMFILATPASLPVVERVGGGLLSKALHYIGLISYSLYLWHWPIRSFQEYIGYENDPMATVLGLLSTAVMGALSYHLVEKTAAAYSKSSAQKRINWRPLITVGVTICSLLVVYGGAKMVRERDGVVQRLDNLPFDNIPTYLFKNPELYLLEGIADKCPNNSMPCYLSDGKRVKASEDWKPDLMLSGDSHSMAIAHALSEAMYGDRKVKILQSGSAACLNFSGYENTQPVDRKFDRCKSANVNFKAVLAAVPAEVPLLFANFFPQYLGEKGRWSKIQYQEGVSAKPFDLKAAWLDMICEIGEVRQVYIMKSVPTTSKPVVRTLLQGVLSGKIKEMDQSFFDKPLSVHQDMTAEEAEMLNRANTECGAVIIDPASVLCNEAVCHGTTKEGVPLYRDGSHMNLYGSRQLIPMFEELLATIARN